MTRPSSGRAKKQSDVDSIILPSGMAVEGEYRFKPPESAIEKKHRLRKDFLSFLVKDLLAYLIASLIIIVATSYSFWMLMHPERSREERQWAMSMLTALGTAVVGFVFGKATK
jgi:hypothetical protein